jgi:hypothetical protein
MKGKTMENKTITEQTEIEQQSLDEAQVQDVVGGTGPAAAAAGAAKSWLDDMFSQSAKRAGNNVKFKTWRYEKGLAN